MKRIDIAPFALVVGCLLNLLGLLALLLILVFLPAGCSRASDAAASSGEASGDAVETEQFSTAAPAAAVQPPEGFLPVSGGRFLMGSPEDEPWRSADEMQHEVSVSDFYMSPYEVTQGEYAALMGENPSQFAGESLPVENLSWYGAIAYCNARSAAEGRTPAYRLDGETVVWDRAADGYRLPTEAEWEYACRAGSSTPFNLDHSPSADEANYYGHYPYEIEGNYFDQSALETRPGQYRETTLPVGSFAPNALGLYDMHGNVGEWVWDHYGAYDAGAAADPTGPETGARRVYRGGGWNDFAKNLRSAYRATLPAEQRSASVGLRLVVGAAGGGAVTAADRPQEAGSGDRLLIAYFSWSGNTEGIARLLEEKTGADVLVIEPVEPYSSDYNTVLDEAQRDQQAQARPALANHVEDMSRYDTILLGYPNWWASIPMPVASFLEEYDFSGKTLLPFCSHGGGRFGQSLTAIAKLAPDAVLGEGLSIHYSGGSALNADVDDWLTLNGIEHS